jgi:hypothetical protein
MDCADVIDDKWPGEFDTTNISTPETFDLLAARKFTMRKLNIPWPSHVVT